MAPRLATALRVVRLLLVALERLDEIGDGLRPEEPGDHDDEPDAGPRRACRRDVDAELRELRRPDLGMTPLVGGDPLERSGPVRLPFDRRSASYRTIASRSSFRFSRLVRTSIGAMARW